MPLIQNTPRLEPFVITELIDAAEHGRAQTLLADTEGVTVFLLSLGEGVEVPEHAPPGDALMQIQEGTVIITVEGTPLHLSQGQSLVIPADATRSLLAQSDMKLQLTLVKRTT